MRVGVLDFKPTDYEKTKRALSTGALPAQWRRMEGAPGRDRDPT